MADANRRRLVVMAELVLDADPSRVWALLADPERLGEWAGVTVIGYMGTELPKIGQSVFIRSARWGRVSRTRRVEIETWDAGASVRCLIHRERSESSIGFEVAIHPEVMHDSIATKVRLIQRMEVAPAGYAATRWWVDSQLKTRLNRIAKVVRQ